MSLPFAPTAEPVDAAIPQLYKNIYWFVETLAAPGVASLGGIWRSPNYGLSYLLAARFLVERSVRKQQEDLIALPATFLQRHALELGLKVLIDEGLSIGHEQRRIRALQAGERPDECAVPTAATTHSLKVLVVHARTALGAVGRVLPDDLAQLAEEFDARENGAHTRWRYSRIVSKKETKDSFGAVTELRLLEMQEKLEAAFEAHLVCRPGAMERSPDEWNLLESLLFETESNLQTLLSLGDEP